MKNQHPIVRFLRWGAFFLLPFFWIGCNGTTPNWVQFHGDGPNTGYMAVNTHLICRLNWHVDLGGLVSCSSPVYDASYNIYININTCLVKVSPGGAVLWKKEFDPAWVTSTPAVSSTGHVYVIANTWLSDQNYASEVHCFSSDGVPLWSYAFVSTVNVPTITAPKIWESGGHVAIFIYRRGMLYAFSEDGRLLAGIEDHHRCTVIHGDSWLWDFFKTVWDAISDLVHYGLPSFNVNGLTLYEKLEWPDPTPAVVSYGRSPYADQPLIVVADECGMCGIQWDPNQENFSTAWTYNHGDASRLTTPVVTSTGTLVTVKKNGSKGTVRFFDIFSDTSKPALFAERDIDDEYPGTPVASLLGGYFYAASKHKIYRFDSMGNFIASADLAGVTYAAPSCSQSYVYVSTTVGLEAFSFDLSQHDKNPVEPNGAGINSPAIGKSRVIVLSDTSGNLYEFY